MTDRLWDTTTDSLLTFGLTNLPSAVHNVGTQNHNRLAAAGEANILAGKMPTPEQLRAMNMSEAEALGIMAVLQMGDADGAADGESIANKDIVSKGPPVNVELKYKQGWTDAQKAEADAKVKALTDAQTVKAHVTRRGTSASARYKSVYGPSSVPVGYDVDHTIDLQLGGADDISNMNPLERSVNRSLGKQVGNAIKHYPDETEFGEFTIH